MWLLLWHPLMQTKHPLHGNAALKLNKIGSGCYTGALCSPTFTFSVWLTPWLQHNDELRQISSLFSAEKRSSCPFAPVNYPFLYIISSRRNYKLQQRELFIVNLKTKARTEIWDELIWISYCHICVGTPTLRSSAQSVGNEVWFFFFFGQIYPIRLRIGEKRYPICKTNHLEPKWPFCSIYY